MSKRAISGSNGAWDERLHGVIRGTVQAGFAVWAEGYVEDEATTVSVREWTNPDPDDRLSDAREAAETYLAGYEADGGDYPSTVFVRDPDGQVHVINVEVYYEPSFSTSVRRRFDHPRQQASDMVKRPAGCRCHMEIGDSSCPVHPGEDDEVSP